MCGSMVDIHYATAQNRRGKKIAETTGRKYNVRICYTQVGHKYHVVIGKAPFTVETMASVHQSRENRLALCSMLTVPLRLTFRLPNVTVSVTVSRLVVFFIKHSVKVNRQYSILLRYLTVSTDASCY